MAIKPTDLEVISHHLNPSLQFRVKCHASFVTDENATS